MVIETGFMYLLGYRSRVIVTVIIFANVLTNLSLNLLLIVLYITEMTAVILLEAAVVAAEYVIYAYFEGRSFRLFAVTLAANVITYLTGLLIF